MVKARRDQVAPYGRVTQAPGFAAALFVEIAFFMLLGCGADPEETELIDQQQDRLYGAVLNDAAGPHVAASALLTMTDGGQCSATLVRPDRILTAAHCLCNAPPANVMFAEANGQIPPPNENPPVYPVLNWQVPPRALVCGSSWVGLGDDDPNGHAPFDIAVLTIGPAPQTGLLPPFQFIPVFLDVPHLTGILTAGQEWAVGYGQNGPLSFTPETVCVGCGVRRAGQVNNVRSVAKSCPGGIDIDCWQGELWTAPSLATSFVETSRGDSGGGLFFNVNPPFPGGPLPVVGGVSSNWWDDEENRTRWARTSNSPDFLWSALGLPYDFSLQGQIDNAAISARLNVKINDRAHVVEFFNTNIGALILGSDVELGPDAVTGPIVARGRPITANDPNTLIGGNVRLADRALATNNVTSYGTIQLGNQAVITGLVEQGRFRKFEEFGLSVPFPNAGFTFQEQPNGSLVPLDPGPYGNYIVRANATLQLRSGVYSYWGLTIEPNAVVVADVSQGPVWVYIHQGPEIFRGPFVTEDPSRLFVGVPGGTFESAEVLLGDQFTATLVAPNSNVIADMRGGTKLLGSFFVRTFELHQGRFLERLAFQHPWVPTCSSGFEGCF